MSSVASRSSSRCLLEAVTLSLRLIMTHAGLRGIRLEFLAADLPFEPLLAGESVAGRAHQQTLATADGEPLATVVPFAAGEGQGWEPLSAELLTPLAALLSREVQLVRLRREHQRLQASEQRLVLSLEGSGTGVWDRDAITGAIHYSRSWKALLGYAEHEVGQRIEESYTRVHPDDLAYVQRTIQAHFDRETPFYQVEHRLRRKDGSYLWVRSRGQVVERDASGRALRMVGTTTDISDQHRLAEQLSLSVALLTDLADEVPGMVYQFVGEPGNEGRFTYVSAGSRAVFGLSPEQVMADIASVRSRIHPEDVALHARGMRVAVLEERPWRLEYRVQLPDDPVPRWRRSIARPKRQADGSVAWHGVVSDIDEQKQTEQALWKEAYTDELTGLPNRRGFMRHLSAQWRRVAAGEPLSVAVLMCDLDHFKQINDRFGHAVGDEALRLFARLFGTRIRLADLAGRVGGEEFAVVLTGVEPAGAQAFAERLRTDLSDTVFMQGVQRVPVTVSIGIAFLQNDDPAAESVLARSDRALYRAKQNGRNRVEYERPE